MRHAVGTGTKQDFEKNWYIADGFGSYRAIGNYYHSGADINLKTGGDSDLGEKIYAISQGSRKYFHFGSHPSRGYGIHYVYEIKGEWGVRWVHIAHNQSDSPIKDKQDFPEGEHLSNIGKSGTKYAHLHLSIFRTDPATLPNGIDTIAKTPNQLDDWWEDPIEFINRWIDYKPPVVEEKYELTYKGEIIATYEENPNDQIKMLTKKVEERDKTIADINLEATSLRAKLIEQESDNGSLTEELQEVRRERDDCRLANSDFLRKLAFMETDNEKLKDNIDTLKNQLAKKDPTKDFNLWERLVWVLGV